MFDILNEILGNYYLSIWITNPYDEAQRYCARTMIPLAVFRNGKAEIILKELIAETGQSDLKDVLFDNVQINVRHVSVGRRDVWKNGVPYLTFKQCTILHTWMPNLVAMGNQDISVVEYFAEIESYDYSWKTTNDE